jgi:hypothetical protein
MVKDGAEKGTDECLHTLKHGIWWGTVNKWCVVINVESFFFFG